MNNKSIDNNISKIKQISERMEKIFYLVITKNLGIKDGSMNDFVKPFADMLNIELYSIRSGPVIQNSKMLYEELSQLDENKFEIIYVNPLDNDEVDVSLLSDPQKIDFVEKLKTDDRITGLIAEDFVLSSEGILIE